VVGLVAFGLASRISSVSNHHRNRWGGFGEMLVKGLAGSIQDNGDEAVKAAEMMSEDINDVMTSLASDMSTSLPTDFSVDTSVGGRDFKMQRPLP
jgi:hypothetical protein